MKTRTSIILPSLFICVILAACGLSQVERDEADTQVSTDNFATQTAQNPTATATNAPRPTTTATLIPSPTPMPNVSATAEAYFNSGVDYYNNGDMAHAISDFDPGFKLDSNNAKASYLRESAKDNIGNLYLAISDFDQSIQLDPTFDDAYFSRGAVNWGKGETENAIADINIVLELCGSNFELCKNAQQALETLGVK